MKRYERKIEKLAKQWVDAPCDWDCKNCQTHREVCRFWTDKEAFKAGALFERDRQERHRKEHGTERIN